jgi:hypothetical protein
MVVRSGNLFVLKTVKVPGGPICRIRSASNKLSRATANNLHRRSPAPLPWTAATLNRVDADAFTSRFNDADAVQYFYEPFLEAFDPELRKELGVWYTPFYDRIAQITHHNSRDMASGLIADKMPALMHERARAGGLEFAANPSETRPLSGEAGL